MSDLLTAQDIKEAVLRHCGELTNGTSSYDEVALEYINKIYKGLLAGGNEFGIDCAHNWRWARANNPILLTLLPAYKTGTATVTQGSRNGTLSVAPTYSLKGYFLQLDNRSDIFKIAQHTASSTSFMLDMPYTADDGTLNFKAMKLDYELVDDSIIIGERNNTFPFNEGGGTLTATITAGVYSPSSLVTAMSVALNALATANITVSYNTITRKFNFLTDGAAFSLLYATALTPWTNILPTLGFYQKDYTSALTYTSDCPLNAIQRLFSPMTVYRQQGLTVMTSPKDLGKIFGISYESMLESWPMFQVICDVPNRFSVTEYREDGTAVARMNAYVGENTRCEVEYIPLCTQLQDNDTSIPLIPQAYRDYLVYGASFYLMLDKSDNRADQFAALAKAKLMALMNSDRAEVARSSQFSGKIIPRANGQFGIRRFWLWSNSNGSND